MADGIEIKVSGLSAVSRKLKRFDKEYKTRVVLASLYAGARVVQKEAKKNVPVKTGRLRRAIILRTSKIKRWKHGEYGVFMTLRTGKGKNDPKDGFYGRWIEDGYETHGPRKVRRSEIVKHFGKRSGRKTGPGKTHMLGVKFIKKSFDNKKRAAVNEIKSKAESATERLARKFNNG